MYCKSRNAPVAQPINLDRQPKQNSIKVVPVRVQMVQEATKNTIQSMLWIREMRGTLLILMLMIIYLKHMVPQQRIKGIKTIQVFTVKTILTAVAITYIIIPRESQPLAQSLTSTALIRTLEFLVLFLNLHQKKSIIIPKKLARFLTQITERKNHHQS